MKESPSKRLQIMLLAFSILQRPFQIIKSVVNQERGAHNIIPIVGRVHIV